MKNPNLATDTFRDVVLHNLKAQAEYLPADTPFMGRCMCGKHGPHTLSETIDLLEAEPPNAEALEYLETLIGVAMRSVRVSRNS